MRRWVLAPLLCVVPVVASAQEADAPATATSTPGAPAQAIVYGALPGGIHAPTAETLPPGSVQLSTLTGYGQRNGLLDPNHKLTRAIGDLAVAYGILDILSVGLSLDGRYDKHHGLPPEGDDGYVGDPHLFVRVGKSTGSVLIGGQLGVWVPGKDAPSIAASAISIDARVLVSLPAGPGLLSFSGGFRLDNSAKSVDDPLKLSLQDRVSLGVSDYHAAFGAAQLRFPAGKLFVAPEVSLDAFVGGPPTPTDMTMVKRASLARGTLILRGGVSAGYHINDQFSAVLFAEMAKVPGINLAQVMDNNIPLVPYEPVFTLGVGLEARFGGPKAQKSPFEQPECARHIPPDCPDVNVPVYAEISGKVVDSAGKPVVGAKVSAVLKNSKQGAPVATDEKGEYTIPNVPIGKTLGGKETIDETAVQIDAEAGNMKPGKATIAKIEKGANKADPITLEPQLPPGQLRGVVRSLPGKPIAGASIVVSPGDAKAETAADGTFQIDLPPGQYKIKVTKSGLKDQELDVNIEQNGVAIKNIEMQK